MIRIMTVDDYEEIYALWAKIHGFGIRSIDDSKEGITRFIKRNPSTSVVAVEDGKIVGSILCGHDGRSGSFYHVCVDEEYRMRGIGKSMAVRALQELEKEHISKVTLDVYATNNGGSAFWNEIGWEKREHMFQYDFVINKENITAFI